MGTKKFTQFGTFTVVIFLPLFLLYTGLFKSLFSNSPDLHIFLALTFLICLLNFYKLTIIVDNVKVSFRLGIGLIRKSYKIENISSCKPVTNSIIYGIGIRRLENGWLYNVSGLKAIELSFKDRFSTVRIGTDRPDEISDYITRLINHAS